MKNIFILWMIYTIRADVSQNCGPVRGGYINSRTASSQLFQQRTNVAVTLFDSGSVQEINLNGQYYGLQITAVDSSTDKTVGTFRIPSGAGTHKKYRLLKCQNSRDSVRHASEKIQKNGVSRFYWTGECTKDVKYIVYIANNGDTDQMNWDILELNCPLEETTSLWAKLDEQPILKSARISQKSPRRYQPRAKVSGAAWSHWAEWGQCLGICGQKNTRSRSRECINAGRKVPVQNCYIDGKGHQIDMEDCTRSCPEWSSWGQWSSCTKTCDSGYKARHRYCILGTATEKCDGNSELKEACNTQACHQEDECKDNYGFCEDWKKLNYCEEQYASWMSTNCKLSCGKCQLSTKSKVCKDQYDQSCWRWSKEGKCDTESQQIRAFVREKCMMSCKLCET